MNWQAVADSLPALAPESPIDAQDCPAGMIRVQGEFLLDSRGKEDSDEIQLAQNEACAHWKTEDHGVNGLCDRFDPERWKNISAKFPRKTLRFCIDRYEYPGVYGEFPLVVTTFDESEARCARENKRLCTESEWTLSCEGEEGLPYPYGYERDPSRCNIDVFGPGPGTDTFRPRTTELTAQGIDLSWRGRRSGESPKCRSPYGVEDLTGNVDEWTRTVRRFGYKMIMKGGHWGPARQRCRPQTRGHGPYYVRYDQGFRCCAD